MSPEDSSPGAFAQSDEPVTTIKVSDIRSGHAEGHYHSAYRFEDIETHEAISADWEIRLKTAGFTVQGDLHGAMTLECVRCLSSFEMPIHLRIDEEYVFSSYVDPYERERELQAEDFYEVADDAGVLDLKDLAHQFLLLEAETRSECGRNDCSLTADSAAN